MAIGSDYTKAFADRLSDLIDFKRREGKTFKDIANESGVPSGSLSKYQNDAAEAGINSLVKLADYFGVSTDYLLGITDISSGNADDMAIAERMGLSRKSIYEISRFMDPNSGDNIFINMLSQTDFWDIIGYLNISFLKYVTAMNEENNFFKDNPQEKLLYHAHHSDYQPERNKNDLTFSLTLTAEHYYNFCLHEASSELDATMRILAEDFLRSVAEEDDKEPKEKKLRSTKRDKKEEQGNGKQ